ncbi:MAG: hypothetical protein ACFNT5_08330, partial [Cardiobacterium hominis]
PAPPPPQMNLDEEPSAAPAALGGDKDTHGCLPTAGQSWSKLRHACIQPFDVADIRLQDPENATLALYIILAADKSQAELFGADHAESLILDSVKGGYASADGKTRLLNTQNGWSIRK